MAGCFCLVLFLSTRIWGITIEGESYHTDDSILKYLDSIGVYGGIAAKDLECSKLEEKIRKKYKDIGWVSVEKKASKIYIRIREVLLVEKEKEKPKGHLVAEEDGRVVSIVTRNGTAKVRAGKKVKKGDILISGAVNIIGDNQELIEKDFVHADGTVVLSSKESYEDILPLKYQKKVYTEREKRIYEWQFGTAKFFCYNPIKNLETFEKYDIIREGGQLCPFLSLRFPVSYYVKVFREIAYQKAQYSEKEARRILKRRLAYYLSQKEEEGYRLKKKNVTLEKGQDAYQLSGTLVFYKEQGKYKKIAKNKANSKNQIKGNGTDGNIGNGN